MLPSSLTASTIAPWDLPSLPLASKGNLPSVPGLYFAIKGDRLLYIGMSENLRNRWRNHHEYKNLKQCGGVRLHYLELRGWSRDRLLKLESELIAEYCPRFNDVGVGQRGRGRDKRRGSRWWVAWLVAVGVMAIGYQVYLPFRSAVDEIRDEIMD